MLLNSKPVKEVPPHGLLYIGQREMAVISPEDGKLFQSFTCFGKPAYARYLNLKGKQDNSKSLPLLPSVYKLL